MLVQFFNNNKSDFHSVNKYIWKDKLEDLKYFIPKYYRKSFKDKHGIVDGGFFLKHLFELRLFLDSKPKEILVLSLKAENKFSSQGKHLLIKIILSILGKYLVTPKQLLEGGSLGRLTFEKCIKSNKRVILIMQPNLMLDKNHKLSFNLRQLHLIVLMNKFFSETIFPVNNCFLKTEENQKESMNSTQADSIKKTEAELQKKGTSTKGMDILLREKTSLVVKMLELIKEMIHKKDEEFWMTGKTLLNWGIFLNKDVLFSKFHNKESAEELFKLTIEQIQTKHLENKGKILINNVTLTLSKNKKQFLKNVINLNLPTLKNLFNQFTNKQQLDYFMFDLILKSQTNKDFPINVFKFDFVNRLKNVIELLIFSNSKKKIEIIHILIFNKKTRKFVKVAHKLLVNQLANGTLYIIDIDKFISDFKKNYEDQKKIKTQIKNRIIVIYKIENRLYLKHCLENKKLIIRPHQETVPNFFPQIPFEFDDKINSRTFEYSEKDELFSSDMRLNSRDEKFAENRYSFGGKRLIKETIKLCPVESRFLQKSLTKIDSPFDKIEPSPEGVLLLCKPSSNGDLNINQQMLNIPEFSGGKRKSNLFGDNWQAEIKKKVLDIETIKEVAEEFPDNLKKKFGPNDTNFMLNNITGNRETKQDVNKKEFSRRW